MKRTTILLLIFIATLGQSIAQTDSVRIQKSNNKVIIGGQMYYVHMVKKGETLFSLSKAYNVSQKEIAKENPDIFLGLQVGQALKIPTSDKRESDDKLLSNDFNYHRVKKGQTLYFLSRKYNVSQEDIIACNPDVKYGIRENQIVKIPKSKKVVDEFKTPVNKSVEDTIKLEEEFIYHKVEPKETIYSLTRFYDIDEDLLLEHNPYLSEGLKVGQILKIPNVLEDIEEASVLLKTEETGEDTALYKQRKWLAYSDSIQWSDCRKIRKPQTEPYQVAVLLPLYLEKNDEEFYIDSTEFDDHGNRIYERIYYDPFHVYPKSVPFVEFYEGFLLAVDSLKEQSLSVNLHVYDTENDTARIKEILSFPELTGMDLIVGPVYNHEIKIVSEFSAQHQIKMVSPFTDNLMLVDENPYLFQVNPSYTSQIDEFARYVSGFGDKNIVLVHNGDSLAYSNVQMVKDKIFNNLSLDTMVNNIQFKEVVFRDSIFVLEHALNDEIENVFIIPSNEEAFVTNVVTKLNTLKAFGNQIKVVGLSRWQRFRNIDPEYFFNLELCIASPFFVDYHHKDVKEFVLKYRETYHTEPDQMAIHAYDIGLYFLSALKDYGKNFDQCIYNYRTDLLQADYKFVKWYKDSGFENTHVDIIQYYNGYNIFRINEMKDEQTVSQTITE